jgi:hypothetical protein
MTTQSRRNGHFISKHGAGQGHSQKRLGAPTGAERKRSAPQPASVPGYPSSRGSWPEEALALLPLPVLGPSIYSPPPLDDSLGGRSFDRSPRLAAEPLTDSCIDRIADAAGFAPKKEAWRLTPMPGPP